MSYHRHLISEIFYFNQEEKKQLLIKLGYKVDLCRVKENVGYKNWDEWVDQEILVAHTFEHLNNFIDQEINRVQREIGIDWIFEQELRKRFKDFIVNKLFDVNTLL